MSDGCFRFNIRISWKRPAVNCWGTSKYSASKGIYCHIAGNKIAGLAMLIG